MTPQHVYDFETLRAVDESWKPDGYRFDSASEQLTQLWDDTSSALTVSYLRQLGLGNKLNQSHPFEVGALRRIVDAMTVVYSVPATRVLAVDGVELDDDDPFTDTLNRAHRLSGYDLLWQRIDAQRNLFRTCVVEWTEDHATGCVGAQMFSPHQVKRFVDSSAPHAVDADDAVALRIRGAADPKHELYRLWHRASDGSWLCHVVNGVGETEGEQPYGDSGQPPFDVLPVQIVTDEHPMFRAWIPIPQSRIAWALGINGSIADLAYLVQMEAHSRKVIKTDSVAAVPTETGPDATIKVPVDGDFQILGTQPKIAESVEVLDQQLRLWAISEYLPGDIFDSSKTPHTGQALKVANHHLAQRRWRQLQLVPTQEADAFTKYVAVHNANARDWGVSLLPDVAELRVTPGRAWQPTDMRELQDTTFKLVAAGFLSRIQAAQELFGFSRAQAIEHLERVRRDEESFPAAEFQNTGAMVDDGPRAALGEGSATLNPDAFNPDVASSVDGASVTAAIASNDE